MGSPKKGNPQSTDNLAAEVERGFDELGKLPSRLDRYATAHERTMVNLSHIRKRINGDTSPLVTSSSTGFYSSNPFISHLEKVSARISRCGHYFGFRHYYTVGK